MRGLQSAILAVTPALTLGTSQIPPTYPGAVIPGLYAILNNAASPPSYPSPWTSPKAPGWEEAYTKAAAFVSQLTLAEKVNLTTGVGWEGELVRRQIPICFD